MKLTNPEKLKAMEYAVNITQAYAGSSATNKVLAAEILEQCFKKIVELLEKN